MCIMKTLLQLLLSSILFSVITASGLSVEVTQAATPENQINADITMGDDYYTHGRYEMAIIKYKEALQKNPSLRILYKKIGDIQRQMKDYPSAVASYQAYLNKSSDKSDTEGINIMLTIADIQERELKQYPEALKTLEGLLSYYYPESLEPMDTIITKYQDSYQVWVSSKEPKWENTDPLWEKAMLYRGRIYELAGQKKEAYEAYTQYYLLCRYCYHCKAAYDYIQPNRFGEWLRLYNENQLKETPEDWIKPPWIIQLSPDKPEYQYPPTGIEVNHRGNRYGYSAPLSYKSDYWVFEAAPGYRIKKLYLTADVLNKTDDNDSHYVYPLDLQFYSPAQNCYFPCMLLGKKGRHPINQTWEPRIPFRSLGLHFNTYIPDGECYSWKIQAELIPECQVVVPATGRAKYNGFFIVNVFPRGGYNYTISVDSGKFVEKGRQQIHIQRFQLEPGWHQVKVESPVFPTRTENYYWAGTCNQEYLLRMGVPWNRTSTNLTLPTEHSKTVLFKDKTNTYRIIMVGKEKGKEVLFSASSKDLVQWTPLARMPVNSWEGDFTPQLAQDPVSGKFILIWRSNRGPGEPGNYSALWEAESFDFDHWNHPKKILPQTSKTFFGSDPSYGLDLNYLPGGRYRLNYCSLYAETDNPVSWNDIKETKFPEVTPITNYMFHYQVMPDGRNLAYVNDYKDVLSFYQSNDGHNYNKTGELLLDNDQLKYGSLYQFLDLGEGSTGFAWAANSGFYLTQSRDLTNWDKQILLFSYDQAHRFSNIVKDPQGKYAVLGDNVLYTVDKLEYAP
jgi:hypothetical protein